jgi:predicted NACHT family NTPase
METKDFTTIFKGPLDKIIGLIGNELQQIFSNRLLEYQTEEYKRNYFSKTILHRAEPKPLDEFYIPLYISEQKHSHPPKRIATNSAEKLLSKWKYITLIGNAGSGKSTIVKYLFVNSFQVGYKIPIKIELRYLNEFKGNLHDYVFNEIFKFQKLGFSNTIIDRLLDSDNFIFFLDGYDEINSNIKTQTTKDIDSFVTKYPKNRYVITSRPYTNIDLLPLFKNFQVCNLQENDIAAFVKKQIPKEEKELADKMIKAISKRENLSYRDFLSNPLLLSMFILTFQSYSDVPQKRSEFYSQVFDTLFSVHDSMSKLAYVREKTSGLSKDQFEEILRLFSFISFFEEKFIFPSNYLSDKLSIIKSKKKSLDFDNTKFVEDLQVAVGILNKEGLDYTFPHRSLQEYFAAVYIEKLGLVNKKSIYEKLKKEIEDNYTSLMSKDHFYGMLSEIDRNYLSRYLAIPIIENLYQELKKVNQIDKKVAYEFYGRLLLPFHILLRTSQHHKDVHDELLSSEIRYIFFGGKKNQFDFSQVDEKQFGKEFNFPKMIEKVSHFRDCGDQIIQRLVKSIDEIDKSDEEIINLI